MRLNKILIDKGIEAMIDILDGADVVDAAAKIEKNGQWTRTFIQFFLYTAHDSKRFIMPRRERIIDMRKYAGFWKSIIPEVRAMLYVMFPSEVPFNYKQRQVDMTFDFIMGNTFWAIAKKNRVTTSRVQQIVVELVYSKLPDFPKDKRMSTTLRKNKKHWLCKLHEYSLTLKEDDVE
jgi:hypothetical protein